MNRTKILVPVDINSESDSALYLARHIASGLNVMISCMYVIEDHEFLKNNYKRNQAKHKNRNSVEIQFAEKVNSILLKDDKTPFELIITTGEVHTKILEKSLDLNVRLIVMGQSNSGGSAKKRIGKNTRLVIKKSKVPVITPCYKKTTDRNHITVPLDLLRIEEHTMNNESYVSHYNSNN